MLIRERKLPGTYEIVLEPKTDERGYFMRTYDAEIFEEYGMNREWVQENHSCSVKTGTIRGLHFQFPPYAEAKLVRATKGRVLDVFVDLREKSETFGQWDSIELTAENKTTVFVPRGFAHGYCALTDDCEVLYKADNFYNPQLEAGVRWNDGTLKIQWGTTAPILSDKDAGLMSFEAFINTHGGIAS